MSENQIPPSSSGHSIVPQSPPRKKGLNPLAVVLVISGIAFLGFMLLAGVSFYALNGMRGEGGDSQGSLFESAKGGIGVIELKGVIMDSEKILKELKQFEENDRIKGVVLRLDSPGGSVGPSQEIYQAVKAYKKPLVASMGSVAASGAYYIACGAKKVYANAGTLTGSIGVIMQFANLEKLYQWAKLERYSLKTGQYKDSGADYRAMRADEKELFQTLLNNVLSQFKKAVQEGRKLKPAQVDLIADGRIFTGEQAKEAGMVDELGSIQDAVKYIAKEAKLGDDPKLIYPRDDKKFDLLEFVMDQQSGEDSKSQVPFMKNLLAALWFRFTGNAVGAQAMEEKIVGVTPGIYWIWSGGAY